jgi:hypothetical protein
MEGVSLALYSDIGAVFIIFMIYLYNFAKVMLGKIILAFSMSNSF